MQLTLSTDIALRTLIYLGRKKEVATIQEIADAFDISKTHLMKVVMTLVKANLLASERGRKGGVKLNTDVNNIYIGEVVHLMENTLALVVCMKDDAPVSPCPLLPQCRLKKVFQEAQDGFFATLNKSTLADVI